MAESNFCGGEFATKKVNVVLQSVLAVAERSPTVSKRSVANATNIQQAPSTIPQQKTTIAQQKTTLAPKTALRTFSKSMRIRGMRKRAAIRNYLGESVVPALKRSDQTATLAKKMPFKRRVSKKSTKSSKDAYMVMSHAKDTVVETVGESQLKSVPVGADMVEGAEDNDADEMNYEYNQEQYNEEAIGEEAAVGTAPKNVEQLKQRRRKRIWIAILFATIFFVVATAITLTAIYLTIGF